jgi:copper chaperone
MSNVVLNVPDISCAHCEKTIVEALQDKPGVRMVEVDIPAKTVRLEHDESVLSLGQVFQILDDEGYSVAGTQTA